MLRHKIFLLYVTSTFDRYEYVYQYWIKVSVTTESLHEKCTVKHFFQVFREQWIGKIALCKNISRSCPLSSLVLLLALFINHHLSNSILGFGLIRHDLNKIELSRQGKHWEIFLATLYLAHDVTSFKQSSFQTS